MGLTRTTGRVDMDRDLADFERRLRKLESGILVPPASAPPRPAPQPPQGVTVESADGATVLSGDRIVVDTTDILTLSDNGGPQIANARAMRVMKAGALQGQRKNVNFIQGSNMTVTVADDPTNDKVDVTLAAAASSGMSNPMTTKGDVVYSSDNSGTPARLGIGAGTQVLGIAAGVPAWVSAGGGAPSTSKYVVEAADAGIPNAVLLGTEINKGTVAARPAAAVAGRLYRPTDGFGTYRDNGSTWDLFGPVLPLTEPLAANFAWTNQGGASVSGTQGGLFLSAPANTSNLRIQDQAAPGATPYSVVIGFIPMLVPLNFCNMGIVLRDTVSGKCVTFYLAFNNGLIFGSDKWTSPTVFSASYTLTWNSASNFKWGPMCWLKVRDDGTNRILSVSNDGQNFMQVFSVGRTDFVTPNRVGFYVNSEQTTIATGMNVLSFFAG